MNESQHIKNLFKANGLQKIPSRLETLLTHKVLESNLGCLTTNGTVLPATAARTTREPREPLIRMLSIT